jgi:hypothetical protein
MFESKRKFFYFAVSPLCQKRQRVLSTAWPPLSLYFQGILLLSASGVSGDINPKYKELYENDAEKSGEQNTYFSKDADGNILYTTHHFEELELTNLISSTGSFEVISFVVEKETSSRRPDQAARFFYVMAKRI